MIINNGLHPGDLAGYRLAIVELRTTGDGAGGKQLYYAGIKLVDSYTFALKSDFDIYLEVEGIEKLLPSDVSRSSVASQAKGIRRLYRILDDTLLVGFHVHHCLNLLESSALHAGVSPELSLMGTIDIPSLAFPLLSSGHVSTLSRRALYKYFEIDVYEDDHWSFVEANMEVVWRLRNMCDVGWRVAQLPEQAQDLALTHLKYLEARVDAERFPELISSLNSTRTSHY